MVRRTLASIIYFLTNANTNSSLMRLTKQGFCKLRAYDRLIWFVDHVKISSSVFRSGIVLMIRALTPNPPPGDTMALFFCIEANVFYICFVLQISRCRNQSSSIFLGMRIQKAKKQLATSVIWWVELLQTPQLPNASQFVLFLIVSAAVSPTSTNP